MLTNFDEHLILAFFYDLADTFLLELGQYSWRALFESIQLLLATIIRYKHYFERSLIITVHEYTQSAVLSHAWQTDLIKADDRGFLLLRIYVVEYHVDI